MLYKTGLSSLLLFFFLCVAPVCADNLSLEPLLTELKHAAAQTETLSSPFVQEKYLDIFAEKLLSDGVFIYQKPDFLRWELLTPMASGFVLRGDDGERWNHLSQEQESFSVTDDPVMGMIAQQLLAWARVDLDWLEGRYRIELQTADPVVLHLYPRDEGEAEFIKYLQIQFSADRSHVVAVQMVEQSGDQTTITFTEVKINSALPSSAFQVPK